MIYCEVEDVETLIGRDRINTVRWKPLLPTASTGSREPMEWLNDQPTLMVAAICGVGAASSGVPGKGP